MRASNKDRKAWMLSVRTSNELRTKLQGALTDSGRTLTQEVEMRLERTFQRDDYVGSPRNAAFLDVLGASIREIEIEHGASWLDDVQVWNQVTDLVGHLLSDRRPDTDYAEQIAEQPTPPRDNSPRPIRVGKADGD